MIAGLIDGFEEVTLLEGFDVFLMFKLTAGMVVLPD